MADDNTEPDGLEALAAAVDINRLIEQGTVMADMLARVALREEHENPALATRAAQAAVRAYGEGVTGVLLAEQIKQVKADVKAIMAQRADPRDMKIFADEGDIIGVDDEGNEIKRPHWARPPAISEDGDDEGDKQ